MTMLAPSAPEASRPQPSPQSLPVNISKSQNINGIHTDILLQCFSDRTFVVITQVGKVGNLLSCSIEESEIDGSKTYNVSTLLGKRDDALLELCARKVAENIYAHEMGQSVGGIGALSLVPPLLLGITLKEGGRDTAAFKEMINLVLELYVQIRPRR
eukprot:CAMPEP_0195516362 /NCGR_PEP_ID=MMETSP0794_2-20130614/7112_1 /TAXON_ID=515487 /ORGANISM="Stephanopyxis turris, Strain CCMP 815" /LENGTH=156 /DNA_ID=CAMNT_0040644939 /DNA_START=55 /DNA_END=525 /DNA_ORIENTATION=+